MALPSPNLDDRRFQQLVDEAKRYVQQRAPEWTDHNVSDPGVTLIETFAYIVDQLLYRLNRVPDKNYTAFLDLLGIRLFPPAAASAEVDFWLSAPQPDAVTLHAGTEVTTADGDAEEPGPGSWARAATSGASSPRPSRGTRCCSGCPRPCRGASSPYGWTAGWRASASTRASRRWCGRPGTAPAGRCARPARTPRAA
jgi:hypothetical protein